jgi:cell division protein FtsL
MTRFARLFERRVRGFRVVEVAALSALVGMIFWVYLTKAEAGRERAQIGEVRQQIVDEQRELKQLRAESAHLEQYRRIETLSRDYLGLEPVRAARETAPEALPTLARERVRDRSPNPAVIR